MKAILIFSVVGGLASVAFAAPQLSTGQINGGAGGVWPDSPRNAPIIWDNGLPTYANGYSSQNDTVYPFNSQVADDFTLDRQNNLVSQYDVTGVRWGGVYWNAAGNPNQGFNILFYDNDPKAPKSPTGRGLPDPSGTARYSQFVPLGAAYERLVGAPAYYTYNTTLELPFRADYHTKYWLAIQAEMIFPPQWGWITSVAQDDNAAVQGFPLLGLPYWGPMDGVSDVSFSLFGVAVPEATSLALLGLGGMGLIRRRRRGTKVRWLASSLSEENCVSRGQNGWLNGADCRVAGIRGDQIMKAILILSVVGGLASAAFALPQLSTGQINGGGGGVWPDSPRNDPIIWDNGAPTNANGYSSQNDTVLPFNSQVADDFTLRRQAQNNDNLPYLVTDVHWAGSYSPGGGNPNMGFNILFYANDNRAPKSPTGRGLPDPSPTAMLEQFVPLGATNETFVAAPDWYVYNTKLQVPFLADKDTKYWLGIQAEMVFPPQWFWTTSVAQDDNVAQQGFPLLGLPYWGPADGVSDMAFLLTGHKIPEPTSLALLALGGLALIRRL